MSCKYSAYLIVGIRMTRSMLVQPVDEPICEHEKPAGAKFCPECGCPAVKKVMRPIEGYDPIRDRYKTWYVYRYAGDHELVVVGRLLSQLSMGGTHDRYDHPLPDPLYLSQLINEVFEQLKDDPLTMSDQSSLGVWHVLDVI